MDGSYDIKLNTPMGAMNGKVMLKTNGENIEGVLEIMGQLTGNILNIYAKTNMGEFKLQGKKVG